MNVRGPTGPQEPPSRGECRRLFYATRKTSLIQPYVSTVLISLYRNYYLQQARTQVHSSLIRYLIKQNPLPYVNYIKCQTLEIRALRFLETKGISHPPTPLNNPADLNPLRFSLNISQESHWMFYSKLKFEFHCAAMNAAFMKQKFSLSSSYRPTFTTFQIPVIIIIIIIIILFYFVLGDLELRRQMMTLISIHISHF